MGLSLFPSFYIDLDRQKQCKEFPKTQISSLPMSLSPKLKHTAILFLPNKIQIHTNPKFLSIFILITLPLLNLTHNSLLPNRPLSKNNKIIDTSHYHPKINPKYQLSILKTLLSLMTPNSKSTSINNSTLNSHKGTPGIILLIRMEKILTLLVQSKIKISDHSPLLLGILWDQTLIEESTPTLQMAT